ncbi:MAG: LysR family transcriptional regulator [Pseudomonadota bacterium]
MAAATYNLARFDLVSIRLAVACVQSGSLTAAAREAHLALAAASRRIRELESAVGEPLFERHARGVTATPAGRVFARHGLALLQTLERMNEELTDMRQGVVRHLRLSASTASISQFLPPLLARYLVLRPQVRIELEEQVSDEVATALREATADVGVFVEGPDTSGLRTQLFRTDELVLVLPAKHKLTGRTPVAFTDALDEDWISLNTGAAMLQQQQQAALAANKPFRLRMQVRSFDAVCHLVASGLGLAILPKMAALPMIRAMKLAWRPLADEWAQRRMLVATRIGTADPAVDDFVAFLVGPSQTTKARARKQQ